MPLTPQTLGRRLQQARKACGFTQAQVASDLEVPRSAIAQIEAGNRSVSSLELDRLARLFGRQLRDFLAEPFEEQDALSALFRAQPAALDQPAVREALRECVALGREISHLEDLLEVDLGAGAVATYSMDPPTNRWQAVVQGERLAEDERRRLGLGDGALPDLAELLENQGIRTAVIDLPDDVSGLTLNDSQLGLFVVANRQHHLLRRRFSLAHEYAHVLADRDRFGLVSRRSERDNLIEVRANAFAAAFLMPEEGVRQLISGLGKWLSRASAEVFDGAEGLEVQGRPGGNQELQLHDLVQLAHHFRVSRTAALYRLKSLGLAPPRVFERLMALEREGKGRGLARHLGLPEPDHEEARNWFRQRSLGLALEAYRREAISLGKLQELAASLQISREEIGLILEDAGLEESPSN